MRRTIGFLVVLALCWALAPAAVAHAQDQLCADAVDALRDYFHGYDHDDDPLTANTSDHTKEQVEAAFKLCDPTWVNTPPPNIHLGPNLSSLAPPPPPVAEETGLGRIFSYRIKIPRN